VLLGYRRDLVEALGIDVSELTTWAKFAEVAREKVVKDLDGDGVPDRYMIDLPDEGGDTVKLLMLQNGGQMFDASGGVAFDSEATAEVIDWYVRQVRGEDRIAFPAGWGQTLARAAIEGLVLFYFVPDWRTQQFENDMAGLSGEMALMPLPAWHEGGRRTTTWGGTGLAITKQCDDPELAWDLAMHLYYNAEELGKRFGQTQILPPLVDAWNEPQIDEPSAYFSGQRIGRMYADLAPRVPAEQSSPYMTLATAKLNEAFTNASLYYRDRGEDGLRDYIHEQLALKADRVRRVMERNVFLDESRVSAGGER